METIEKVKCEFFEKIKSCDRDDVLIFVYFLIFFIKIS